MLIISDADVELSVCRAQILAKKVSPRAFVDQSNKKGQNAGEVGIEGTTIQAADAVRVYHTSQAALQNIVTVQKEFDQSQRVFRAEGHINEGRSPAFATLLLRLHVSR